LRDGDMDVMAAGTLERSDGKRGSVALYPCQAHAFTTLGTVLLLG
jgi:hypothetical protein